MRSCRFARAVWVVLALAGCDAEKGPGGVEAEGPLASIASPVVEWTFDACVADPAWTSGPHGDPAAERWVTMTPLQDTPSGCGARLEFKDSVAAVGFEPVGVKGQGYGMSFRVRFPSVDYGVSDVTTRWRLALMSQETGEGDPDKLWQYAVDATLQEARQALVAADVPALRARVDVTLTKLDTALDGVNRQVPALSGDARALLSDARAATADLRDLAGRLGGKADGALGHLERVLASLDQGDGLAAQLLRDREIYYDLKELVRDLKQHPWKVLWKD